MGAKASRVPRGHPAEKDKGGLRPALQLVWFSEAKMEELEWVIFPWQTSSAFTNKVLMNFYAYKLLTYVGKFVDTGSKRENSEPKGVCIFFTL